MYLTVLDLKYKYKYKYAKVLVPKYKYKYKYILDPSSGHNPMSCNGLPGEHVEMATLHCVGRILFMPKGQPHHLG